jgi:ADP-L-glycero-D-manno-heptose 6-epimerase
MPEFIVTGGAGFIGSNLVAALNLRGCEDILIVDRIDHPAKESNLAGLHYRELQDIDKFRCALHNEQIPAAKTVFHLGACSSTTETNAAYLLDNNTLYTTELCQWALTKGVRFIYASSAATYGDGSHGYSDDDAVTTALQPLNLYAKSKHDFDLAAIKAGWLHRIAGLKYFNVYGKNEDHKGEMCSVVHKAYHQIRNTGELQLFRSYRSDFRDGEQRRDFVYIKDAVDVTLFLHDNPEVYGLFNCGTGKSRTWLDLGLAVFTAMGHMPHITFIDMPIGIQDKYQYYTEANLTKLQSTGNKQIFTTLEDGVCEYVQKYLLASIP